MRQLRFYQCLCLLVLGSCTAGHQSSQATYDDEPASMPAKLAAVSDAVPPIHYKIFLDNSYSMNGYFNGGTAFLSTLNKLITETSNAAEDQQSSCKLFYLNSDIQYYGNTKSDRIDIFLSRINNHFSDNRKKSRGNTDLKDVLGSVIDSVQRNSVSIIVTDAISSPGLKGQEAATYMD
ncbi:MAG: hypothetical protein EOP49_08970, partial [Sphingobacteriales bacterium]